MNPDIQKAFHEAVSNNDIETARRMIAAGADVNAPYDEYENRSFLDACYRGNLDMVKMLVSAGADVNLPDSCGTVPLTRAIVSIHETHDVVKYLIKCGANVNACEGESWTPLETAVHENAADIVKILLEAGANPQICSEKSESPLMMAADWGYVDIIEMLLEAGADPNSEYEDNYTPLAVACRWGHAEAAELLLAAGANPHNADSCYNDSVLMDAAEGNHPKCIKMLLDRNVDVNHVNFDDETALLYAVLRPNNEKIVSMLLEAGANPNISGGKLGSPLSIVMRDKEFRSAELLIKFGAKFPRSEDYYAEEVLENINDHILFYNMKDNGIPFRTDEAAVVLYAKHACSYLLRKALEAGANPNAADSTGKSALEWALEHPRHSQGCAGRLIQHGATFNPDLILYAVRKRKRELFKALLKAGADVNVADEKGNTALHYATRTNREYFVRDLIGAGANIEARNKADYTPLMLAVRYRRYSAAGCLLANGADEYAIGSKYRESSMAMCRRYHCQIKNNKLLKKEWNSETLKNLTPFRFCWAAQSGGIAKIQSLKDQGLDINTQDEEGYTALHLGRDLEEVIPLLIQSGADMYIETYPNEWESPYTPAMLAADGSALECLKKFLACGYDVNHKDSYGTTLLMFCACRFLPSSVEFLLENGANPSLKDNKGQTALFYATSYNKVCYDEIIDYLLEYGANINEVDNDGNTALLAIADQEIEGDATHRDLIDRGIDVNIRNNAGQTALSIAKLHGHKRLIAELLEAGAIDS